MAITTNGDPRGVLKNLASQIRDLPIESQHSSKLANFTIDAAENQKFNDNILWEYINNIDSLITNLMAGNPNITPNKNRRDRIGGSGKGNAGVNQNQNNAPGGGQGPIYGLGSPPYSGLSNTTEEPNIVTKKRLKQVGHANNTEINFYKGKKTGINLPPAPMDTKDAISHPSSRNIGNKSSNIGALITNLITSLQYSTRAAISTSNWEDKKLKQGNTVVLSFEGLELKGFIDESGFSIGVNNKYDNLFGDGVFTSLGKTIHQASVLGSSFSEAEAKWKSTGDLGGSLNTAVGGETSAGLANDGKGAIILNTAMYYAGSEPLHIGFNFYQIADTPGEILHNYREALKAVSPNQAGQRINWDVEGPKLATIDLWGNLLLKEVLIESLTCHVKSPFDESKSPIIGQYTIKAKTQKILDRQEIDKIFGITIGDVLGAIAGSFGF